MWSGANATPCQKGRELIRRHLITRIRVPLGLSKMGKKLNSVIQEMDNIMVVLSGVLERVDILEKSVFSKPHGLVLFKPKGTWLNPT